MIELKKTAKQMFEELGWKCVAKEKSGDGIIYETPTLLGGTNRIVFYRRKIEITYVKKFKDFEVRDMDTKTIYSFGAYLNMLELQAINKQVEELGWGGKRK